MDASTVLRTTVHWSEPPFILWLVFQKEAVTCRHEILKMSISWQIGRRQYLCNRESASSSARDFWWICVVFRDWSCISEACEWNEWYRPQFRTHCLLFFEVLLLTFLSHEISSSDKGKVADLIIQVRKVMMLRGCTLLLCTSCYYAFFPQIWSEKRAHWWLCPSGR